MDNYIAIIDLETTGFSHTKNNIVEIGIARLDVLTGEITKLLDVVVREETFGPHCKKEWVFKNTSLTYAEVIKAKPLEFYRKQIQEIFNTYPITAFNTGFDFRFLRDRKFIIDVTVPCLMNSSTNVLKIPHPKYIFKKPNFQEAWNFFNKGADYIEAHRAYDDAEHEAKYAYQLFKYMNENN